MTDPLADSLRQQVIRGFPGARRIAVLADRRGRLVLAGDPTGEEIVAASMLLTIVFGRLPPRHGYVSPAIPGPLLLRLVAHRDRGSILLAPVFEEGMAVGAIVVEGKHGMMFSAEDLARLETMAATSAASSHPAV